MKFSISVLLLLFLAACAPARNAPVASTSPTPNSAIASPISRSPEAAPSIEPTPVPSARPKPAEPESTSDQASTATRQATLTARDASAKINVRADASTESTAQHYGLPGDRVSILNQKPGDDGLTWYQVKFPQSGATGWVRSDFIALAETPSSQPQLPAPTSQASTPIRSPQSGRCDCPYDTDRRGRSCGARSAYSRPGGSAPACYVGEK